jgi:integrase
MQFLTQEELKRLLAVIKKKRDKALFLLAYRHGLRASEIGLLQRTDVDLKQGRITIHRLKGSLSGIYPLQPDVIKLLRAYLRARTDSSPYLFISNRGVPIDRLTLAYRLQHARNSTCATKPFSLLFAILRLHSCPCTILAPWPADVAVVGGGPRRCEVREEG